MATQATASRAASQPQSPFVRYRNYVTRNWPLWWSLRLGRPAAFAAAIALVTTLFALTPDMTTNWTSDPVRFREKMDRLHSIESLMDYSVRDRLERFDPARATEAFRQEIIPLLARLREEQARALAAGTAPPPGPQPRPSWEIQSMEMRNAILRKVTIPNYDELIALIQMSAKHRAHGNILASLAIIPIFFSLLFLCSWFFIIGRSMKFVYAPQLGHQPRVWIMVLAGIGVLCSSLVGFKVLEWRAYSISPLDTSHFGDLYGPVRDQMYRHGNLALVFFSFGASFISTAAIFTALYRCYSLAIAAGGLVVVVLGLIFTLLMWAMLMQSTASHGEIKVVLVTWAILAAAAVATFAWYRSNRGPSALAVATMLYLLSIGPVWFIVYWCRHLNYVDASAVFSRVGTSGFPIVVLVSVVACEAIFWIVNSMRIRPA